MLTDVYDVIREVTKTPLSSRFFSLLFFVTLLFLCVGHIIECILVQPDQTYQRNLTLHNLAAAAQVATTRRVKKQYPEPIKVWKVVRGDKVEVITGKEKGKRGTILKVPHT